MSDERENRPREPLFVTNPVWCLEWEREHYRPPLFTFQAYAKDLLATRGTRLAQAVLDDLVRRRFLDPDHGHVGQPAVPGVVGLLLDRRQGFGLVSPLRVSAASDGVWKQSRALPFDEQRFKDLLLAVLDEGGLPQLGAETELLSLELRDDLDIPSSGRSMDVAALLAALGALAPNRPACLAAACSVAQPPEDLRGDKRVQPVESISTKLGAFVREYGHGTLLVRPQECDEAAAYDSRFDDVWKIEDLRGLNQRLHRHGLLKPLLNQTVLRTSSYDGIRARVAHLRARSLWPAALDFLERVVSCKVDVTVPAALALLPRRLSIELSRNLGLHGRASHAAKILSQELGHRASWPSHDERAEVAVEVAATYFDLHRFERALEILGPWLGRVGRQPAVVSSMTRVKLWNTAARLRIALRRPGWHALLTQSMQLQKVAHPGDVGRTRGYLIHGLLRHGSLAQARKQIAANEKDELTAFGRSFLAFYKAEAARRRGTKWVHPELEAILPTSATVTHDRAFYYQATARQPGRERSDSARRFALACAFFTANAEVEPLSNLNRMLATVMALAESAVLEDASSWRQQLATLDEFLESPGNRHIRRYYAGTRRELGKSPSRDAMERLLERIPFF